MSDVVIYDNLDRDSSIPDKESVSKGAGEGLVQKNKRLFTASETAGIHLDQYGFKAKPQKGDGSKIKKLENDYNEKMKRQGARWNVYIKDPKKLNNRTEDLKQLVRKGIPPELRGKVWLTLCQIQEKRKTEKQGYYKTLGVKAQTLTNKQHIQQIEKDICRTFPDNVVFEKAESEGVIMLRRILTAYSVRNPAVGYCQSLNFIVALFLLFMDEEDAFWMLAMFVEDMACVREPTGDNPKTYFYHQSDLLGIRIDQFVFRDLVSEKLPKISSKLDELNLPLEPLTVNWFLCMLVNTLPLEVVLRVWDCYFSEGVKVIFRAALTLLKVNEKRILKAKDMGQLMTFLRGFSHSYINCNQFMKTLFSRFWLGSFPMARINFLREWHKAKLDPEGIRGNILKQIINKEEVITEDAAKPKGKSKFMWGDDADKPIKTKETKESPKENKESPKETPEEVKAVVETEEVKAVEIEEKATETQQRTSEARLATVAGVPVLLRKVTASSTAPARSQEAHSEDDDDGHEEEEEKNEGQEKDEKETDKDVADESAVDPVDQANGQDLDQDTLMKEESIMTTPVKQQQQQKKKKKKKKKELVYPYHARTLYDYKAMDEREMSISMGDIVIICERNDGGWALARSADRLTSGWVPLGYIKRLRRKKDRSNSSASSASSRSENDDGKMDVEYHEESQEDAIEPNVATEENVNVEMDGNEESVMDTSIQDDEQDMDKGEPEEINSSRMDSTATSPTFDSPGFNSPTSQFQENNQDDSHLKNLQDIDQTEKLQILNSAQKKRPPPLPTSPVPPASYTPTSRRSTVMRTESIDEGALPPTPRLSDVGSPISQDEMSSTSDLGVLPYPNTGLEPVVEQQHEPDENDNNQQDPMTISITQSNNKNNQDPQTPSSPIPIPDDEPDTAQDTLSVEQQKQKQKQKTRHSPQTMQDDNEDDEETNNDQSTPPPAPDSEEPVSSKVPMDREPSGEDMKDITSPSEMKDTSPLPSNGQEITELDRSGTGSDRLDRSRHGSESKFDRERKDSAPDGVPQLESKGSEIQEHIESDDDDDDEEEDPMDELPPIAEEDENIGDPDDDDDDEAPSTSGEIKSPSKTYEKYEGMEDDEGPPPDVPVNQPPKERPLPSSPSEGELLELTAPAPKNDPGSPSRLAPKGVAPTPPPERPDAARDATMARFWPQRPLAFDLLGDEEGASPDEIATDANAAFLDPKFASRAGNLTKHIGQLQPEQDYKKCFICNAAIKGESLYALGQLWHPEHFTCGGTCGRSMVGQAYFVQGSRPYCKEDYLKKFGKKCMACNNYVLDGVGIGSKDGPDQPVYHTECLKCVKCGRITGDGSPFFQGPDRRFYCERDYQSAFLKKCFVCKKVIRPDPNNPATMGMILNEKEYHATCLICCVCNKPLADVALRGEGVYFSHVREGALYCGKHNGEMSHCCSTCSEPLGLFRNNVTIDRLQYHECCLKCSKCSRKLIRGSPGADGTHAFRGKLFCQQHFEEQSYVRCTRCNNVIHDNPVTFDKKPFHPNCVRCSVCTISLNNGGPVYISPTDNLPRCTQHVPPPAPTPDKPPSTSTIPRQSVSRIDRASVFQEPNPKDHAFYEGNLPASRQSTVARPSTVSRPSSAFPPSQLSEARMTIAHDPRDDPSARGARMTTVKDTREPSPSMSSPPQTSGSCLGCRKPTFKGETVLAIRGGRYHERCLCCTECKLPFPGGRGIFFRDDKLFCKDHYLANFTPKCVGCNEYITGGKLASTATSTGVWKFHSECFNCTDCKTTLVGQKFVLREDLKKMLCSSCASKLKASGGASSPPSRTPVPRPTISSGSGNPTPSSSTTPSTNETSRPTSQTISSQRPSTMPTKSAPARPDGATSRFPSSSISTTTPSSPQNPISRTGPTPSLSTTKPLTKPNPTPSSINQQPQQTRTISPSVNSSSGPPTSTTNRSTGLSVAGGASRSGPPSSTGASASSGGSSSTSSGTTTYPPSSVRTSTSTSTRPSLTGPGNDTRKKDFSKLLQKFQPPPE